MTMSVVATYAAEDRVAQVLQRGGTIDFHGSQLDLGRARLRPFHPALLPVMQGAVDALYAAGGGDGAAPLVVMSKRALRRAVYRPWEHRIVLPASPWAWESELVLMHELAHSLAPSVGGQRAAHGQPWRRAYCDLVRRSVGPEAALLLMEALDLEPVGA